MNPCSSFAASYSEFSDKSPNERATLIFSTTSGRLTVFNSSSSRSNFQNLLESLDIAFDFPYCHLPLLNYTIAC